MKSDIQKRLVWIKLYDETKNAGLVCRRCGISRPTLRKWWKRYQLEGEAGLISQSRRPKSSPNQKVFQEQEQWVLTLRQERNLGARRIQHELQRLHDLSLSLPTIHKILKKHEVDPLRKVGRRKQVKRYQKEVPGERIQMDTLKIRPGLYQWTAIDDCTRFLAVALFARRTAQNTLHFLEPLMDMMPFPIQRLQTDRGREFTAYKVQDQLWEWGIKFRPNRPGAPHLNGKVERVQQTILQEFYSTADLDDPELDMRLEEWMFYYNWHRVHGSLGETPSNKFSRLIDKTPFWADLEPLFDVDQEKARIQSYGRGSRKN